MYVDGVISKNGIAIKDGLGLFRTIKEKLAVILLCEDKTKTEYWLKQNGVMTLDNILDYTATTPTEDMDYRLAEWCRSQGTIDYVVTANTDLATKLLECGFRVLLFLDPVYIDYRHRPDSTNGRKSWIELNAELDRQVVMLLDDPRL
jgi:hypothetical protein